MVFSPDSFIDQLDVFIAAEAALNAATGDGDDWQAAQANYDSKLNTLLDPFRVGDGAGEAAISLRNWLEALQANASDDNAATIGTITLRGETYTPAEFLVFLDYNVPGADALIGPMLGTLDTDIKGAYRGQMIFDALFQARGSENANPTIYRPDGTDWFSLTPAMAAELGDELTFESNYAPFIAHAVTQSPDVLVSMLAELPLSTQIDILSIPGFAQSVLDQGGQGHFDTLSAYIQSEGAYATTGLTYSVQSYQDAVMTQWAIEWGNTDISEDERQANWAATAAQFALGATPEHNPDARLFAGLTDSPTPPLDGWPVELTADGIPLAARSPVDQVNQAVIAIQTVQQNVDTQIAEEEALANAPELSFDELNDEEKRAALQAIRDGDMARFSEFDSDDNGVTGRWGFKDALDAFWYALGDIGNDDFGINDIGTLISHFTGVFQHILGSQGVSGIVEGLTGIVGDMDLIGNPPIDITPNFNNNYVDPQELERQRIEESIM